MHIEQQYLWVSMGIYDVTSADVSGRCAYKVAIMSLKVNGEKGFCRINSLFWVFSVISSSGWNFQYRKSVKSSCVIGNTSSGAGVSPTMSKIVQLSSVIMSTRSSSGKVILDETGGVSSSVGDW